MKPQSDAPMLRNTLILGICLWGAASWWTSRPIEQPPGVLAEASPIQTDLAGAAWFDHGDYQITPLATIELTARILGRENYRFDGGADLVPTDLALGWGPMSDSEVLQHLEISQSGRFYFWRANELPVPRRDIEVHSANMHLIPATDRVRDTVAETREGQLVSLRGYLVRVDRNDGWEWQSSLTREDTGAGACELIWVEELTIL